MNDKAFGGRLLAFLSSLRLAVVTMVTLGSVCGFATFYEMEHGTPAVQREIYQTPWFALILGLLGLNVFSVMVSRYPWTKHHIGFLVAHVGILLVLTGSVYSLYRGLDSNMALFEGATSGRVELLEKAVHVSVPGLGVSGAFPVVFEKHPPAPGREKRYALPGSDLVLVADDYQPHVAIVESFAPADAGAPALHFVLQAPMATQEQWLVADDPQRRQLDLGMVSFEFSTAASDAQAADLLGASAGANHLSFVIRSDGALLFAAADGSGAVREGTVETGKPIPTGWPAMGVTVDRFLPRARLERTVKPETPPAKEERRQPAVRLHLEGPKGKGEPEWVPWGESVRVAYLDQTASLAYRSPEAELPFKVTLLKFNNEPYPGSRMASTFESKVRVEDPEEGTFETLISMNHPLHHRGYIFFQSSFVEGRPMMSIFSVARAPGLPLVYLGTTLIGVGIVWMFYVKPWLARRQAAAALAAHRARENRNEANAADPLSARA
ncbi:MAG TPA: cytochrome c biogenesis protein ResB [Vicinamibacteria bacterium]|nr:cytochrome c biogenesis protein ResB [Vicinamibacteria bacterium]